MILVIACMKASGAPRFSLCEWSIEATRWLSWYGVGLASADRLPVVVRIPLVHSGVSSATRRKATGADHKKSASGLSSTMAMSISSHLLMRAGLPACICSRIATALFHKVSFPLLYSPCCFVCFLAFLAILGCDDTMLPSPA